MDTARLAPRGAAPIADGAASFADADRSAEPWGPGWADPQNLGVGASLAEQCLVVEPPPLKGERMPRLPGSPTGLTGRMKTLRRCRPNPQPLFPESRLAVQDEALERSQ
jgi:hypothetical protein